MKPCTRPLDPQDIEALAAGAEALVSPEAAEHARACSQCGAAVEAGAGLTRELESLEGPSVPRDLHDRVLRLRPFSGRERVSLAIWGGPWLLTTLLFAAGVLVLAPGLAGREQAGLLLAAAAPAIAVLRAAARTLTDLATTAPAGLAALSEALRGQLLLALSALGLLLPAALGLRRAFSRARR